MALSLANFYADVAPWPLKLHYMGDSYPIHFTYSYTKSVPSFSSYVKDTKKVVKYF
jgi:hypothetical protein